MPPQPLLCIYHANCLDGFTAAWAVWKRFPETEFVAGHYQDPPPDCTGREVVMVDFSYKRPVLLEIAAQAKSVMILDHHKSAEAELIDLPANVIAEFDMERSGAMMAWNHYYPDRAPSLLIQYVQDRDLWRFEYNETKPFCAHLFCIGMDFANWDYIYDFCRLSSVSDNDEFKQFLSTGRTLEHKHSKDVQALIDSSATRILIGGFDVPCLNAPFIFASEAGNRLCKDEPFSVTWYETAKSRIFSLRSDEHGEDVSVIADLFGGGGHRHAAGFKIPVTSWESIGCITKINGKPS